MKLLILYHIPEKNTNAAGKKRRTKLDFVGGWQHMRQTWTDLAMEAHGGAQSRCMRGGIERTEVVIKDEKTSRELMHKSTYKAYQEVIEYNYELPY